MIVFRYAEVIPHLTIRHLISHLFYLYICFIDCVSQQDSASEFPKWKKLFEFSTF